MFTSMYYYGLRMLSYLMLISLLILRVDRLKNFYEIVWVLSYVLLCQLSMYLLKMKNKHKMHHIAFLIISLLELVCILVLSKIASVTVYFLVYILLLDIIMFYKRKIGLFFSFLVMVVSSYSLYTDVGHSLEVFLFYIGSLIAVWLISSYLRILENKKNAAQDFYDRLRITEEELTKANEELESYTRTVEELTLLRERTRMSRELHDSVGHALSTLCIQLKAVQTIVDKKPELASQMIGNNVSYVEHALENVRRTVRELKPIEFESMDAIFTIEEMIKAFSKMTGMDVKLILSKDKWTMKSDQSHHLYRIIQESMSNALRHGQAKHITVSIQFLQDKLYASIKDDGKGCEEVSPSFGLKGIRERAASLGGSVEYYTGIGEGFTTKVTLPKDKIVL